MSLLGPGRHLVAPSPLHMQQAFGIDDQGEIIGYGALTNGNQHEFLLIPNDH